MLDDERTGRTADVMAKTGFDASKASYLRKELLDHGIVISAGHGSLMFNIPYLAGFIQREDSPASELERVKEWRL